MIKWYKTSICILESQSIGREHMKLSILPRYPENFRRLSTSLTIDCIGSHESFRYTMRHFLAFRQVLLLLALLGVLANCDSNHCDEDEDLKPSTAYLTDPYCWNERENYNQMNCSCGLGYKVMDNKKCRRGFCSPEFQSTEAGDCVRCPDVNERWCGFLGLCICKKNHTRNLSHKCVPCVNDQISNGIIPCLYNRYSEYIIPDNEIYKCGENEHLNTVIHECQCNIGYGRNRDRHCVPCSVENNHIIDNNGVCKCREGFRLTNQDTCQRNFGITFCSIGFVIFAVLGLFFGFIIGE